MSFMAFCRARLLITLGESMTANLLHTQVVTDCVFGLRTFDVVDMFFHYLRYKEEFYCRDILVL